MTVFVNDPDFTLHVGDVTDVLATLPADSVHCVVTSPPYWGLRDYGTGTWDGGNPDCDHAPEQRGGRFASPVSAKQASNAGSGTMSERDCKCGATRVDRQLGLEPTPEQYVARMVAVFAEVRRVLRPDGTLWLNIGDSYASGEIGRHDRSDGYEGAFSRRSAQGERKQARLSSGLKPKDLVGIPWRLAFALQADGWCLRSEIVWSKLNPMPESVTDRPTKAHEQLFLLTKATWKGGPIQPWPMNREDAIWLAAIVDGEGSICFQERERADCENSVGPRLSIVNTNRALLERVTEITSFDVNQTPHPRTRSNGDSGRPVYSWQVTNEKAARIIAAIRPHLIAKCEQAELALYVHVLNQKHKGRGGHVTTSSDLALKRKASAACSALNHGEYVDLSWLSPVATGRWVPNPYSYDADAIREPHSRDWWHETVGEGSLGDEHRPRPRGGWGDGGKRHGNGDPSGRNKRSVWEIATESYPEAHFATFPQALVEPCIKAGCPEQVCATCGKARERIVEREREYDHVTTQASHADSPYATQDAGGIRNGVFVKTETVGFTDCGHGNYVPGTVLDPFMGSGTTALVARRLGRRSIGIELNQGYAELAGRRLAQLSLLAEPAA